MSNAKYDLDLDKLCFLCFEKANPSVNKIFAIFSNIYFYQSFNIGKFYLKNNLINLIPCLSNILSFKMYHL